MGLPAHANETRRHIAFRCISFAGAFTRGWLDGCPPIAKAQRMPIERIIWRGLTSMMRSSSRALWAYK